MKTVKQLLTELPTKPVIITYGRFNPPTSGHELLIQTVRKLSKSLNIPYRIYATSTQDKKKNPLSQKDKIKYMEKSFKDPHIFAAKGNIIQLLQSLEREHFKEIHVVVGSDRVKEFDSLLNKYNGKDYKFDKIQIHSAGERDPDADDATGMSASKMRKAAEEGNYKSFEIGCSKNISSSDKKKMYNDVRKGLGLQVESFVINIENKNELREKYLNGEIFNLGTTVQDEKGVYEIMDRGTNYITVINENGELSKKWLDSVKEVITDMKFNSTDNPEQVSFKGFTTKNFEVVPELKQIIESAIELEKDSVAMINALKSLDESLGFYKQNKEIFKIPLLKGVDAIKNIDHAISGMVSDLISKLPQTTEIKEANVMNFTGADKIKVARILAGALGVDAPEKMSNPEQLVNMGLRKVRTKRITPELENVISKMLKTADMLDIKYDKGLIPSVMKEDLKEDRLASLRSSMTDLMAKLGKISPADKDAKTKMAIIKSDIATLKLRIADAVAKAKSKAEGIDVLDPVGLSGTIEDPLSLAVMPSFIKFGESIEESNKYTIKTIVKDPAATADGEKNESKEKSRVVISTSPEEAKKKAAASLKDSGYTIISQTVIKTEKLSEEEKKDLFEAGGLWANIHARRKKGLRKLRPGEKGYPKTLDINSKENDEDEDEEEICETAAAGLAAKAEKSGISISILRKVYNRGMAAWKTGHRPGTTPQQWGMARVNSYITKGKGTYYGADKDLREQEEINEGDTSNLPTVKKDKESGLPMKYVSGLSASTAKKRAAHFDKNKDKADNDASAYKSAPGDADAKTKESKHTKKYRDMYGEDMDEEVYEACWDGYKQIGMKKKNGKEVPNCVPEEAVEESHFKVGDKVIYKDKKVEIIKVDEPQTGSYYTIKVDDKEVKASPDELDYIKENDYRKVFGEAKANKAVESIIGLIRRFKESKKTMLVARPNNLMKAGQEKVVRIPVEKWADYRKKGYIQAEETENEKS